MQCYGGPMDGAMIDQPLTDGAKVVRGITKVFAGRFRDGTVVRAWDWSNAGQLMDVIYQRRGDRLVFCRMDLPGRT